MVLLEFRPLPELEYLLLLPLPGLEFPPLPLPLPLLELEELRLLEPELLEELDEEEDEEEGKAAKAVSSAATRAAPERLEKAWDDKVTWVEDVRTLA